MPEGMSDLGFDGSRLGFGGATGLGRVADPLGALALGPGATAEPRRGAKGAAFTSSVGSVPEKVVGAGERAVTAGALLALSTVAGARLAQVLAIAPTSEKTKAPPSAPTAR
jgi:hypothetical protein